MPLSLPAAHPVRLKAWRKAFRSANQSNIWPVRRTADLRYCLPDDIPAGQFTRLLVIMFSFIQDGRLTARLLSIQTCRPAIMPSCRLDRHPAFKKACLPSQEVKQAATVSRKRPPDTISPAATLRFPLHCWEGEREGGGRISPTGGKGGMIIARRVAASAAHHPCRTGPPTVIWGPGRARTIAIPTACRGCGCHERREVRRAAGVALAGTRPATWLFWRCG